MNRRGCLIAVGSIFGLLLICCILVWFAGIPRLRDSISDSFTDELSTQVAIQLDANAPGAEAGTYTLSVADLQRQIDANVDSSTASDFEISVDPTGMAIQFQSGEQSFGYTGTPVARDGELVIDDMEVDNEFLSWIMPADKMASTVENGVNNYFEAEGLEIESITLGDNEITFVTVPIGN